MPRAVLAWGFLTPQLGGNQSRFGLGLILSRVGKISQSPHLGTFSMPPGLAISRGEDCSPIPPTFRGFEGGGFQLGAGGTKFRLPFRCTNFVQQSSGFRTKDKPAVRKTHASYSPSCAPSAGFSGAGVSAPLDCGAGASCGPSEPSGAGVGSLPSVESRVVCGASEGGGITISSG